MHVIEQPSASAAEMKVLLTALTGLRKGDASVRLPVDWTGLPCRLAEVFNDVVAMNQRMTEELKRLSEVVGKQGKLNKRASLDGVSGFWRDSIESVNELIDDLVHPTSETARVIGAVAQGDLSQTMALEVDDRPLHGEFLRTARTINKMVDQLGSFASEVTRVAREVGTEGMLGGQADVQGVAGTWKDLTESVNFMASNLTGQVRNIADVTKAVANGDLSKKITVDVKGEILELKNTVNTMVDQLRSFAAEVTRVAREVGTEGKLGGQADVQGVAGTWKDLTESVNSMAGNLTAQVRNIADVTKAVANGDLSKKITVDVKGEILELKNTVNTMVDQLRSFAAEVTRVAREVGTEGKLGGQADVQGVAGTWKDLTDSVNSMARNLTVQLRDVSKVATAIASGDLTQKITVDVRGEILQIKNVINIMVDQLSSFASEVTRVAREVGTEGMLGGQADVKGVSGTWKDLTDSVNFMAGNLTSQVRGIAKVVTAVATGDLKQMLTVEAKGEIAALADTINGMIDTLATFADQVTTVAREVGVEGKLGGQAKVPGAAGTWKGLTENVNQLAANLTTQVRAIAEVATAVTQGDLTRSITVEAQGEVAALKDTTNEMISNLRDTTRKNTEQDWLKTNLAKFSRMLQGQKDLSTVGRLILSELAPVVSAQHAVFYVLDASTAGQGPRLRLLASYAATGQNRMRQYLELGEGLVGQCALEKEKILLTAVPPDYIHISSGLGEAPPQNILVLPVIFEDQVRGVLELASFDCFNPTHQAFLDQLTESIGIVINTIEANTRTEDLLKQSQSLAQELQSRQQELQQTNQALQEKARLLAYQNQEVERNTQEVEQARQALEEKARQLALTSKYKSEFLANMSHELRTPLNSLLILSDQLCKNPEGNLTAKQIEFSRTIHSSGNDLLMLINDILDLSKIESGTVVVDPSELYLDELEHYVERTFRHVAESKNLEFLIRLDANLPRSMFTDAKRLQQVLKNMLSNAFKFTRSGRVTLSVEPARDGWSPDNESLNRAGEVLAFSVTDTGIGIPADKQQLIFEAFQQADGSTSRKFGGTGLGLAISRELSRLLGGEIRLVSSAGRGSAFTLYLPHIYTLPRGPRKATIGATAPELMSEASSNPPLARGEGGDGPAPEQKSARVNEADRSGEEIAVKAAGTTPPPAIHVGEAGDDREAVMPGDQVLLIVENDPGLARTLLEAAREKGFKGVVSLYGGAALTLAGEYKPAAIALDLCLPDINGWRILARLKNDLATRHIPLCVISTEDAPEGALAFGALSVIAKPIQDKDAVDAWLDRLQDYVSCEKNVLVVEPDPARREQIVEGISAKDLRILVAPERETALRLLREHRIHCTVLNPGAPDLAPAELVAELEREPVLGKAPVILYRTGQEVSGRDDDWKRLGKRVMLRLADDHEQLLEQVTLCLHRDAAGLPDEQRRLLQERHQRNQPLAGRKVLIVDDDMRNIFALSSVLEEHDMTILSTDNGRDAVELLRAQRDIDAVLMDIMMPELDGIATLREIRKLPFLRNLPIIAVTAKAMKGDRERCIEAGAWDYLSKPVDSEQMLAVLRAWLYR
jgi:signal transduction histidine kinase/HAMP domain-containing protein/DNA-binding response OmpR family regulator